VLGSSQVGAPNAVIVFTFTPRHDHGRW
jgi:hypothetical protein